MNIIENPHQVRKLLDRKVATLGEDNRRSYEPKIRNDRIYR